LSGPLKRLHFSTGNDHGPPSGAQRKAGSLADTAAASSDQRLSTPEQAGRIWRQVNPCPGSKTDFHSPRKLGRK
jgi:hypothetical protein